MLRLFLEQRLTNTCVKLQEVQLFQSGKSYNCLLIINSSQIDSEKCFR